MSAGHSWSSIKNYSLSEVGVFLKATINNERESAAQKLSTIWMGNNLSQEGLLDTLKGMGIKQRKIEPTDSEVKANWMNLVGALKGA